MTSLIDSIKVLWGMGLSFSPKNTAILVVDVQPEYCSATELGNHRTEARAERIQSLMPAFRKVGFPVYAVHVNQKKTKRENINFHIFKPEKTDRTSRKNHASAFHNTLLNGRLKIREIENLLVCGFWADACVAATAVDAKSKNYNVCIIRDMTGADRERYEQVAENRLTGQGILYADSDEILTAARLLPKGSVQR